MEAKKFDKILGGIWGVILGDVLGAPFEFRNTSPKLKWTGLVAEVPVTIHFKYHSLTLEAGSVTDDSEMSIQLLKSILDEGTYDVDKVIKNYLDWANLKNTPLGKNTRNLMKGVTTVKGFRNRQTKFDTSGVESNGSLMRCFPLVLLPKDEWKKYSDIDVTLTNDNDVNREASLIYLTVARHFIYGEPIIFECKQPSIRQAISDALNNNKVDVSHNKGWVVHALYVALITLFNAKSFESGMQFIANNFFQGTDTDTIMAITSGILCSKYGFDKIKKEKLTSVNIERINNYFAKTDRPALTPEIIEKLRKF